MSKRTSKHIPSHIDADKLPKRTWYDKSGKGKWMLRYKDDVTGKWRSKRLCSSLASMAEIWQAVESEQQPSELTFAILSTEFQKTHTWNRLSPLTQRDYIDCHNSIIDKKANNMTLGNIAIKLWTTGTVRKYRDSRAKTSESRANKELAYIKRIFSWAYEYEHVKKNPSLGVKKLTIKPRQHYAEDKDYYFMLTAAKNSAYWYAPIAMELAYLCRMRLSEVLDLTDANALNNGLLIKRRKGSKDNIVAWYPRLSEAWNTAINRRNSILRQRKQPLPVSTDKRYVLISDRTGDKVQVSSLKTAMARIGKQAEQAAKDQGVEFIRFTFHDLKRKGVSDTSGDKQEASGHRSAQMLNVYDVKPAVVKPAGEK